MITQEHQQALLAQDPYLWIDKVVYIDDDKIIAEKFLDPSLELFTAHYKQFPLFPGALQCEAAFQASAILLARTLPTSEGHLPVISRVKDVKFKKLVRPGSQMKIEVKRIERFGHAALLKGIISVDDETTTSLNFVATQADIRQL